eukprot:SAG22_NODE_2996_length_2040_cov_2.528594_2_plen_166_part_00
MAITLDEAIGTLQGMFADIPAETLTLVRAPQPCPISRARFTAVPLTRTHLYFPVPFFPSRCTWQVLEAHSGHMERTIEYLLESQLEAVPQPAATAAQSAAASLDLGPAAGGGGGGLGGGAPVGDSAAVEADFAAALTVRLAPLPCASVYRTRFNVLRLYLSAAGN